MTSHLLQSCYFTEESTGFLVSYDQISHGHSESLRHSTTELTEMDNMTTQRGNICRRKRRGVSLN